jgi:hypothetical protein
MNRLLVSGRILFVCAVMLRVACAQQSTTQPATPQKFALNRVQTSLSLNTIIIRSSGTPGTIPLFQPGPTLGNSMLTQSGNHVGVNTPSPGATLEVTGNVKIADGTQGSGKVLTSDNAGAASWQNLPVVAGVPSGAVMFFNLGSCPAGWTELTAARGRYIVALPAGGTLGGTDGTPLSDLEDRPVGQHTHTITDPGHVHSYINNGIVQNYCGSNSCQVVRGFTNHRLEHNGYHYQSCRWSVRHQCAIYSAFGVPEKLADCVLRFANCSHHPPARNIRGKSACALFRRRHVDIHGLDSHSSRTGKTVPHDLSRAGKQSGGEPLKLRIHLDRAVFVDPAAGLDVNLFAGPERDFKNVSVSVDPNDAFAIRAVK